MTLEQIPLENKTILITGSTDGVGKLVARRLAESGARVLLHGRSAEKGEHAVREIREAIAGKSRPEPTLEYFRGDFASLDEVRRLADAIRQRHDRLDILINNAGIGGGIRGQVRGGTGVGGYELRFAVNYLAPFLLTHLLLPTLIASAPSRIVNVSSIGQYPIDFDNVMLERDYDGYRAYRQSKLAQILFTIDLAEQLVAQRARVTVNALHPASLMNTKMVYESFGSTMSTVEDGADAILYVATSSQLDSTTGRYFDQQRLARPHDQAFDAAARRQLRDLSLRLTKLAGATEAQPASA